MPAGVIPHATCRGALDLVVFSQRRDVALMQPFGTCITPASPRPYERFISIIPLRVVVESRRPTPDLFRARRSDAGSANEQGRSPASDVAFNLL